MRDQPGKTEFGLDERLEFGLHRWPRCRRTALIRRWSRQEALQQSAVQGARHLGVGSGEVPDWAGVQTDRLSQTGGRLYGRGQLRTETHALEHRRDRRRPLS